MSDPLFLILSGTYVGPELIAEFGALPPCFLPKGTQRLFEEQIAFARTLTSDIALLLPASFHPSRFDKLAMRANDVRIVATDETLTVAESLAAALSYLHVEGRVFVLFGDTVIDYGERVSEEDSFASGTTRHLAKWADFECHDDRIEFHERIQAAGEGRDVVAGFFDFADATLLHQLAEAHSDFVAVLNAYSAVRPLHPIRSSRWLDFGHLHTYYWSRRTELAARAFNQVVGDGVTIRKTGTPARKIFAEARWFESLPIRLRPYVPHFIELSRQPELAYELEYLHLPVISELYCFARLPPLIWATILSSCREFLGLCQTIKPEPFETTPDFHNRFHDDMLIGKSLARLETFASSSGLSLDRPWTFNGSPMPSLAATAQRMIGLVRRPAPDDICLWHGDFHFANIFFDFRSQRVRVVDPRGMLSDGTLSMFGDARYDIAKLTHSVVGRYDDVVAGRYTLDYDGGYSIELGFDDDDERQSLIDEYLVCMIGRYSPATAETMAITSLLFLSMLPLHDNNPERQMTLLANGLRLARFAETLA